MERSDDMHESVHNSNDRKGTTVSRASRRRVRPLVGILAASMLLPLVAMAGPASAAEPVPGARDTTRFGCPTGEVPPSGFTDTAGNTFAAQIDCLAWYDITQGGPSGRPANQYGPRLQVRRDQMASFIARTLDDADQNILPAYDGQNQFTDVAANSPHVAAINRLADAGVVLGRDNNVYEPNQGVRRDQMASFIARAVRAIFEDSVCTTARDYFDDDNASVHEDCINATTDMGITQGDPGANYNPGGIVTRDQMAGFITRFIDIMVEEGVMETPA
jgi:hypothetical protein